MAASEPRQRRRNRLKRAPRLLWLAGWARWPRPLVGLLLVVVFLLAAVVWPPFVWVAAFVWGLWAAVVVLDAGLRRSQGVIAAMIAIIFGPLGVCLVMWSRRRAIRKVPDDGLSWPMGYAVVALLAGFVLSALMMGIVLREAPHGVDVPRAAMGDRIMAGDRVLVVPKRLAPVGRGDVVAVDRFEGVDAALSSSGGIAGVGRIIGSAGEVIGAIDGALYICKKLPDAAVGLQPEDECTTPSELMYLRTPTPDFGPIRIPTGTVWVMSDDRAGTLIDSRVYGAVPEQALMGRVVAVLTPLSRIGIL